MVAGNWKMNGSIEKVRQFVAELPSFENVEVVICPPSLFINYANKGDFQIGAQNCSEKSHGAFTGELSVEMLKEAGCKYVIIGHSERREYQKESDLLIAEKVSAAIEKGIVPILCIGESLEVREAGKVFEHIEAQLKAVLGTCGEAFINNGVIAYEPVWAIGTGKTATPEQAQIQAVCLYSTVAVSIQITQTYCLLKKT